MKRPCFPAALIPFFRWIATYYMHPLGQVISTALPAGLNLADIAILTMGDAGTRAMQSASLSPLEAGVLSALAAGPASIKQVEKAVGQTGCVGLDPWNAPTGMDPVDRHIKGRQIRPRTVRWVAVTGVRARPPGRLSPQRQAILERLQSEGDLSVPALKARVPNCPDTDPGHGESRAGENLCEDRLPGSVRRSHRNRTSRLCSPMNRDEAVNSMVPSCWGRDSKRSCWPA